MAGFVAERTKSILFYPGYEWRVIAAEKRSLKDDFFGYALVLILLGTASQAIGSFFFVRNVLDIDAYRFSLPLMQAISFLLLQALTVIILTFFVHGVAGKFLSDKDFKKSGKLVIYSLTPVYLCYILANLDKRLFLVMIASIYSLILFAKGLQALINTKPQKVIAFTFLIGLMTLGSNFLLEVMFKLLTNIFFPELQLSPGF